VSVGGLEVPDLVTTQLRLRRPRLADAGLIALDVSDARVARMTTAILHPYPPGAAEAFIERALSPAATGTIWILDTGADDENGLVGMISLKTRNGEAEIGYWVAPAFWGAGFAGEAVEAVVGHAASLGLSAVMAQVFQDNPASIKVLTRAGFDYLGEGEAHSVARGGMTPTFRYQRLLDPT
jgi:RimJ/RimL family protein N-acetyltransferase